MSMYKSELSIINDIYLDNNNNKNNYNKFEYITDCKTGKKVYLTPQDAIDAKNKSGLRGRDKRHYKCNECGYWHLSTIFNKTKRIENCKR